MSRHDARSRQLRRRPSRTIPATLTAVALTVLGLLVVVAAVARFRNGNWPPAVTGVAGATAALTWGSVVTAIVGAVLALVGLLLLIAAISRGSLKTARLASPASDSVVDGTDFVISSRAMAQLAAARADRVDGVDKVSASASGRRVRVKVVTASEQVEHIRERVSRGVTETLSATGVQPLPRVTATVRTKGI